MLAYLFSLLGCLIFYLLCDRNDDFVKFHLNQALVLGIAQVIYQLLVRMDLPLVRLLGLFMFFAWIVGMYGAVMGKKVEIPLLSNIKII